MYCTWGAKTLQSHTVLCSAVTIHIQQLNFLLRRSTFTKCSIVAVATGWAVAQCTHHLTLLLVQLRRREERRRRRPLQQLVLPTAGGRGAAHRRACIMFQLWCCLASTLLRRAKVRFLRKLFSTALAYPVSVFFFLSSYAVVVTAWEGIQGHSKISFKETHFHSQQNTNHCHKDFMRDITSSNNFLLSQNSHMKLLQEFKAIFQNSQIHYFISSHFFWFLATTMKYFWSWNFT